MLMNGYEKLFFGQGIAPMPQSTRGGASGMQPFDLNNYKHGMVQQPNVASVMMPMNIDGSHNTLKNESVFVSVTGNKDYLPAMRQASNQN
jgi:hypothetical protein